jgi:hypothetical protein
MVDEAKFYLHTHFLDVSFSSSKILLMDGSEIPIAVQNALNMLQFLYFFSKLFLLTSKITHKYMLYMQKIRLSNRYILLVNVFCTPNFSVLLCSMFLTQHYQLCTLPICNLNDTCNM